MDLEIVKNKRTGVIFMHLSVEGEQCDKRQWLCPMKELSVDEASIAFGQIMFSGYILEVNNQSLFEILGTRNGVDYEVLSLAEQIPKRSF